MLSAFYLAFCIAASASTGGSKNSDARTPTPLDWNVLGASAESSQKAASSGRFKIPPIPILSDDEE